MYLRQSYYLAFFRYQPESTCIGKTSFLWVSDTQSRYITHGLTRGVMIGICFCIKMYFSIISTYFQKNRKKALPFICLNQYFLNKYSKYGKIFIVVFSF